MFSWLSKSVFRLAGWKTVHNLPNDLKKGIFAVAPHATWLDFLIGVGARADLGISIGYLGKAELFKPPHGWLFKALGGTPVVRSRSTNFVQQVAATFNKHTSLLVAIAPEGTRKNVKKLKTGFYYMAHTAGVPIIMVGFDYPRKTVFIEKPFYTSGDFEADMKAFFVPFFKQIEGEKKDWIDNYEKGIFN
ncbi:1-acyl-sn-glycerol-3-phosphate acyltransferase [Emticicia sp. TH156]|uniref:1-acyl-sn-glycerol-3-phosphate acyltransferase n=1 Tax=Emticicia sp. TH156 TaxID=2067454 RepID=UPI000C775CD4|nr:1-acyl-sn-glycerol-3-phosphate acyltransferase [Emticicia sp. TH156]PLK42998.1 glycerol acyltransferase [Emticicia sp. TH156]